MSIPINTSKLTLEDVARLAGVSRSTVSRVINVQTNVSEEARQRVMTVDEETGHNIVVWEPVNDLSTGLYHVWREGTVAGEYVSIGTVPFGGVTQLVDTDVSPEEQQYLYKVSVSDTCGNESLPSNYHKALFLQYDGGNDEGKVNLTWQRYEIDSQPLSFSTYWIYRGTDSTDLVKIKEISGSLSNWSDTDPGVTDQKYYYRIAGILDEQCDPNTALKAGTGPYNHSLSNLDNNRFKSDVGLEDRMDARYSLNVYPNPFREFLVYSYTLDHVSDVRLEIYNAVGAKIYERSDRGMAPGPYLQKVNAAGLDMQESMYYLKLTVDDHVMVRKVMHRH